MSTGRVWVEIEPRDTVQVRDGRAFEAGNAVRAETVRPLPSTVGGAVAAAYGGDQEAIRGPVLVHRQGRDRTPYFPAPADLVVDRGGRTLWRLSPEPREEAGTATDLDTALAGGGQDPLRPLAEPREAGEARAWTALVPGEALGRYLRGGLCLAGGETSAGDWSPAEQDPLLPETRIGLARDSGRAARTGYFYQSVHWRLREGWAFAAEVDRPPGHGAAPRGPVRFGGRGRIADITEVTGSGIGWPSGPRDPRDFPGGRVLLYVATPAVWPGGWLPPLPRGARLVAAAVGDPLPVATASPRGGYRAFTESRSLTWAVPPGSVYLLAFGEGPGGDPWEAARFARERHGRALAPAARPRMDTAGFGIVLTGAWS